MWAIFLMRLFCTSLPAAPRVNCPPVPFPLIIPLQKIGPLCSSAVVLVQQSVLIYSTCTLLFAINDTVPFQCDDVAEVYTTECCSVLKYKFIRIFLDITVQHSYERL